MLRYVKHTGRQAGTTLVELLVYIALVSIGMTAVYSVLISNIKTYDSIESTLVMHQDMRSALDMMMKEIRRAGCNPTSAAGIGFQTSSDDRYNTDDDSIHFTTDLASIGNEPDGATNGVNEDVGYYLEDGTLFRRARYQDGTALQAQPLIEHVTAFTLTYFKRDGVTSAGAPPTFSDIWFVNIVLEGETQNVDRLSKKLKTEHLETRVRIRNQGM